MASHGFKRGNVKPYRIDWRFLPDLLLKWKDAIRHAVNRMGGSEYMPSPLARIWFATIRSGVFRSMRSAGVVFVHVPRTGGTSISQALYGRNLPHLSMAYYQALAGDKLAELPSFAVIRDPVDRLASAYRFIRAGGTSIIASSRYDPYGLAKAPSFDAFVRIIAAQPDCRKAYDTLRPQAAFVTGEDGRVLVDRLFAFDDLRNGHPELRAWVGTGVLPHINEAVATPIHCSAATHALIDRIYAEDRSLYRLVGKGQGPIRPIAIIRHRARRKSMPAALPS